MKIKFIGVGEAFDGNHSNTSLFIEDAGLLIDCGYSSMQSLWRDGTYNKINVIFISHFHADHTFGLPALLMRYREEKRVEPLVIVGARGTEKYVKDITELAYAGYIDKPGFELVFKEIDSESELEINSAILSFAKASHADSSYALRIEHKSKSLVYSGDTSYCAEIAELAKDADILVHEAYASQMEKEAKGLSGHSSFLSCGLCAANSGCKALFLVHIGRDSRDTAAIEEEVRKAYKGALIIPKEGDIVEV